MCPEEKKPDSRSVRETKMRIQTAFLGLLKEKTVEQITIREITERAQINRTSFYRYYLDVYDLYDQIVDLFAEKFQEIASFILLQVIQGKSFAFHDTAFEFWRKNQELLDIYLKDSRLLNKTKERNVSYLKRLLQIEEDDKNIDFILEFYVAGQIGLLTYWMQHAEQISQKEFFLLMQDMIFRGPMTILKERIPQDSFIQIKMQDVAPLHTPSTIL